MAKPDAGRSTARSRAGDCPCASLSMAVAMLLIRSSVASHVSSSGEVPSVESSSRAYRSICSRGGSVGVKGGASATERAVAPGGAIAPGGAAVPCRDRENQAPPAIAAATSTTYTTTLGPGEDGAEGATGAESPCPVSSGRSSSDVMVTSCSPERVRMRTGTQGASEARWRRCRCQHGYCARVALRSMSRLRAASAKLGFRRRACSNCAMASLTRPFEPSAMPRLLCAST